MPQIKDLSADVVTRALAGEGLPLAVTPLNCRLTCDFPWFVESFLALYGDYETYDPETCFTDVVMDIAPANFPKRLFRKQAFIGVDGVYPFAPLPIEQAYPMFEWGLNWCVSNYLHGRLSFHAACIATTEPNPRAIILPGAPGSGKSTLTAAAVARGYTLLTDELTLLDLDTMDLLPVPRPVSLKNESIQVIRDYWPEAVFSRGIKDTTKGTVAHVKVPEASLAARWQRPQPALIVFPRFKAGARTECQALTEGDAFMRLVEQSFNFQVQGQRGFEGVSRLVRQAPAYELHYSRLDNGLAMLAELLANPGHEGVGDA